MSSTTQMVAEDICPYFLIEQIRLNLKREKCELIFERTLRIRFKIAIIQIVPTGFQLPDQVRDLESGKIKRYAGFYHFHRELL